MAGRPPLCMSSLRRDRPRGVFLLALGDLAHAFSVGAGGFELDVAPNAVIADQVNVDVGPYPFI